MSAGFLAVACPLRTCAVTGGQVLAQFGAASVPGASAMSRSRPAGRGRAAVSYPQLTAMAYGACPTVIGVPALPVAVLIGVTVSAKLLAV